MTNSRKMISGVAAAVTLPGLVCGASVMPPLRAAHAQSAAAVSLPQAKISFVPPKGYQKADRKTLPVQAQQAVIVYFLPSLSGFATNANLTMRAAPPGIIVNSEAASHLGDSIKQTDPTYKQVAVGTLMVNGEKGAFLTCTFQLQNKPVECKQVIFIHKGQIYDWCFMASTPAFAKQVGAFDKMVASIKWL